MASSYTQVFWVDATNASTIEYSYKKAAKNLGTLADAKISLDAALGTLELYRGSWFLLFDGADNVEEIGQLWVPGIRGDIIYTSRNPRLRGLPSSQIQCVAEMGEGEASRLLLKSAHLDDSAVEFREQALEIVRELGCLALAVDQAGAYIWNAECTIHDFLDNFNTHREYLMQNAAYKGASNNDRAVYATWTLSYNAIAEQAKSANADISKRGTAALQILHLLPFFHNENIMEEIFKYAAERAKTRFGTHLDAVKRTLLGLRSNGDWYPLFFRQGIQLLLSFSLLGQEASQGRFLMHRLVYLWAYDILTTAEKYTFCSQARAILASSISMTNETTDYPFRRDLLPHLIALRGRTDFPSISKTDKDLSHFAEIFNQAGHYKEAEELAVRVVKTCERVLGERHEDTLSEKSYLAYTYRVQFRLKEAAELQSRTVKTLKEIPGENDDWLLWSMNELASIYLAQKRWTDAENLYLEVIARDKGIRGETYLDILTSMAGLATVYYEQKRWKEAEDLDVSVMESRKRLLGEEHPRTLEAMHNLACTLQTLGRSEEAFPLMRKCVHLRERVLDLQDPSTKHSIEALMEWEGSGPGDDETKEDSGLGRIGARLKGTKWRQRLRESLYWRNLKGSKSID